MYIVQWVSEYLNLRELLALRCVSKTLLYDVTIVSTIHISTTYTISLNLLNTLRLFSQCKHMYFSCVLPMKVCVSQLMGNLCFHRLISLYIHTLQPNRYKQLQSTELTIGQPLIQPLIQPSDQTLVQPHACLPSLLSLHIEHAKCNGQVILELIMHTSNLHTFTLSNAQQFTNEHLQSLLSFLSHSCENIYISTCMFLTQVIISSSILKILHLTHCPNLIQVLFDETCVSCIQCDFSFTSINSLSIQQLLSIPTIHLSSLKLVNCKHILHLYIHSLTISQIDLTFCINLTILDIYANILHTLSLNQCSSLEHVYIQSNILNNLNISMLIQMNHIRIICPCLQYMNLSGCMQLNRVIINKSDGILEIFHEKSAIFHEKSVKNSSIIIHNNDEQIHTYFTMLNEITLYWPQLIINEWTHTWPMYTTASSIRSSTHTSSSARRANSMY